MKNYSRQEYVDAAMTTPSDVSICLCSSTAVSVWLSAATMHLYGAIVIHQPQHYPSKCTHVIVCEHTSIACNHLCRQDYSHYAFVDDLLVSGALVICC